jgi:galactonate dehydratase
LTLLPMTSTVSICTGENLLGLEAYEPFLRSKEINIISIDLLWNGLSESVLIAKRALALGKKVTIHNYYSHFATSMALTFTEILPETELLEFDNDDVPWRENVVLTCHQNQDGQIRHQSALGWGNEIREDVISGITSERVEHYRSLVNFLNLMLDHH